MQRTYLNVRIYFMSLASDVFGVYQKRFTSYSSFIGD
nr:MAG TPA_asm: hypothetical protein [Caudoviricetes sp.]DAU23299.1 MAG TPA: hypothetical protein [Caudoviricetes sp.]